MELHNQIKNTVNFHADLDLEVILRRMNLFGIWQIQNVEQVHALSIPTLPAPETFNFFFKNMNYCKKLKIYMRPRLRRW